MKLYKNILLLASMLLVLGAGATSCSREDNDIDTGKTVLVPRVRKQNDFDKWLEHNFLLPYNIDVKYRHDENDLSRDYHVAPPDQTKSIQLAHLVKYLCLEPYDIVTGKTAADGSVEPSQAFIRSYFPKALVFVGSSMINPNGTRTLGIAEGGRKISLIEVNKMDLSNYYWMKDNFFHTIHHEFGHILNQTKPYARDFEQITPNYVSESWNEAWTTSDRRFLNSVLSHFKTERLIEVWTIDERNKKLKKESDSLNTELELAREELELLEGNPSPTPELVALMAELRTKVDTYPTRIAELATQIAANSALIREKRTPEYEEDIRKYNLVIDYINPYSPVKGRFSIADILAIRAGFFSSYASKDAGEDFVETQAFYTTDSDERLEARRLIASTKAGALEALDRKLALVSAYLEQSWGISLEKLREIYQARSKNIPSEAELSSTVINN